MEADGLWKAALRSARLPTVLGKRRVKLGVSHSSHSPRQRRNHLREQHRDRSHHLMPISQATPPPLILFQASSMSPVNVLDLSGTFNGGFIAEGRG